MCLCRFHSLQMCLHTVTKTNPKPCPTSGVYPFWLKFLPLLKIPVGQNSQNCIAQGIFQRIWTVPGCLGLPPTMTTTMATHSHQFVVNDRFLISRLSFAFYPHPIKGTGTVMAKWSARTQSIFFRARIAGCRNKWKWRGKKIACVWPDRRRRFCTVSNSAGYDGTHSRVHTKT